MTPPEFQEDAAPYTLFFEIDGLERIADMPIWRFPRWHDPQRVYQRGLLALLKVQDVLASE